MVTRPGTCAGAARICDSGDPQRGGFRFEPSALQLARVRLGLFKQVKLGERRACQQIGRSKARIGVLGSLRGHCESASDQLLQGVGRKIR